MRARTEEEQRGWPKQTAKRNGEKARRMSKAKGRQEAGREWWKELKIQGPVRKPGINRDHAAANQSAGGRK